MSILAKYRPKHFPYEGVTTWDHSSYDCFINALKAQSEGLTIHSEPFVELLGIPLLYNHTINDADLVRSFFNSDKAMALIIDPLYKHTDVVLDFKGRALKF